MSGLAPAAINYKYGGHRRRERRHRVGRPTPVDVQATGVPTNLNTGGGNDVVNVGNVSNQISSITGPLAINGQAGTDTINVRDQGSGAAESYTLSATTLASSDAATITFGTVERLNLNAGALGDTLTVTATPGAPVTFNGGGGSDTLIGPNLTNTWSMTGANAGSLSNITFAGVANLTGGSANDIFNFSNGKGVTNGIVNGGAGTRHAELSAYTTGVTVDLTAGTATGTGGVVNIQNVTGSPANDSIKGNSASNVIRRRRRQRQAQRRPRRQRHVHPGGHPGCLDNRHRHRHRRHAQGANMAGTWNLTGANAGTSATGSPSRASPT